MHRWLAIIVGLTCLQACGSTTDEPNSPTEAGVDEAGKPGTDGIVPFPTSDASGSDASGDAAPPAACTDALNPPDGGDCNTLTLDAPPVSVMNVATDPPVGAGGTIVDGFYWKTAAVNYTGPDGSSGPAGTTQASVFQIHCGVWEIVNQAPTDQRHIAGQFTHSSDGQCALNLTCGDNVSPSSISRFDATPTTITFYSYERSAPPFGSTYTLKGPVR